MEPITSSSRYMSIDLLFTTGSGARIGTRGIVLGIGATTRVGGICTLAGHMTGIGIIAMLSIIITTTALSVRDVPSAAVIMSYITA